MDGCKIGVACAFGRLTPTASKLQFPTFPPNLQVAKWEGVGLQNRLFVGHAFGNAARTIPTLESNLLQRSLMAKPQAHNLVIAGISFGDAYANDSRRGDQCTDGVTATSRSPKSLFEVQILVCALSCPHRKSLHTRLMVRQLSQEQSTTGSNPVCEQQLFQLARHTWCRSEVVERHVFQACD
jgi:hypothetical protein